MTIQTLTLWEFVDQLNECGIASHLVYRPMPDIEQVVIRTPDGDAACCAVHREGAWLVLDLGGKLNVD